MAGVVVSVSTSRKKFSLLVIVTAVVVSVVVVMATVVSMIMAAMVVATVITANNVYGCVAYDEKAQEWRQEKYVCVQH